MRVGTLGVLTTTMMMAAAVPAWAEQAAAKPDAKSEDGIIPGKFSGTAGLTSDYLFRGISQTDSDPAFQGSIEWRHDVGVFLGVWGSNVEFNDSDQASLELDWYAGYAGTYGPVGYDIRAIYYNYPGASVARDYDFWELALALTHEPVKGLSLTAGYNFSPEYFAESGNAHYIHGEAAYTVPGLPLPVKLTAGLGRQFIDNNRAFGVPDYWHWNAGFSVDIKGVAVALVYSDTDIERRRCGASLDLCGGRLVGSLTYSF